MTNPEPRTFTHPDVLAAVAAGAAWADPETDPARIDWAPRLRAAAIPFELVDGRPVNPCERTGIRYGRNELGHWGEQVCADALVSAHDAAGHRWIVMVERTDGHGWALPGGYVDSGEDPTDAAVRELQEETGLTANPRDPWVTTLPARYVPDPRGSDEAWMVTVPVRIDFGPCQYPWQLPQPTAGDDAVGATWMLADTFEALTAYVADEFYDEIFPAHRAMLADVLGAGR